MARRTRKTNGREMIPVAPEVPEAVVTFPVGEIPDGVYLGTHVDVHLDRIQRTAMRQLVEGFRAHPRQLGNGKLIQTGADVVRYLCEQVAEAVG